MSAENASVQRFDVVSVRVRKSDPVLTIVVGLLIHRPSDHRHLVLGFFGDGL